MPDAPDEPDWHDVALLLSSAPLRATDETLDETPDELSASVSLPPAADLTQWAAAAHGPGGVYPPLDALRLTLPRGMGGRLMWTLGAVLLLCVAILVLRMLP